MAAEKRRNARVTGLVLGSWHRGAVHCPSESVNLSLGGCFVASFDQTPPSGRFRLWLRLPQNELVWLTGEVVHFQMNQGFGVRFIELSETDRHGLTEAMSQLRTAAPHPHDH